MSGRRSDDHAAPAAAIKLSDEELYWIAEFVGPLAPTQRSQFVREVARVLGEAASGEPDDAAVHRAVTTVQRKFFDL